MQGKTSNKRDSHRMVAVSLITSGLYLEFLLVITLVPDDYVTVRPPTLTRGIPFA